MSLSPRILFIFLDGVGLGDDDPAYNPLAAASLPTLTGLLGGRRLLASTPRLEGSRATFIPTDPTLGVSGLPQSATGQAAILTGRNAPRLVGGHWGPKPNEAVAQVIRSHNIFRALVSRGRRAALVNAYPQRYFDAILSGRRIYSTIPLAVHSAGLPLFTLEDLRVGRALSADFTGEGWRRDLGYEDTPVHSPSEAGRLLARISAEYHFAFFEHWPTDIAGHRGSLEEAVRLVEHFDAVLGGLLEAWDDEAGLIVITSDHGNLEDKRTRHHTPNRVPTLVIGARRSEFADGLTDLTDIAPAALRFLTP